MSILAMTYLARARAPRNAVDARSNPEAALATAYVIEEAPA